MATSRQGMRRIDVDGHEYFWRVKTDDYQHAQVSVCTAIAFERGHHGQWLHFAVPYVFPVVAELPEFRVTITITPRIVRRAIELARTKTPPFIGDDGHPDVVLRDAADDAALFGMTADEVVEAALADSDLALRTRHLGRLLLAWGNLAAIVAALPHHETRVVDWLCTNADAVTTACGGLRAWFDSARTHPSQQPWRVGLPLLVRHCNALGIDIGLAVGDLA